MRISRIEIGSTLSVALLLVPAAATAYPGGTPTYQTDAAPFCAGCHSSRSAEMLSGSGERADKELSEAKHISVILSGQKGYEQLSESDRKTLADQIRGLDVASTVTLTAPANVPPGATFEVAVQVTGGAGPVVGIMLVDRDHRWYARPASSAGWWVVAPPRISGPDGELQTEWLGRRPEAADRNLSYVNVTGIASDSAAAKWSSAQVIFTLRAPALPGSYPLAAAYLYGTEKSTLLGYTTDTMGRKRVRGGTSGGSGRVLFSGVQEIGVVASPVPAPPGPAAKPSTPPAPTRPASEAIPTPTPATAPPSPTPATRLAPAPPREPAVDEAPAPS